jgi:signal transduction histidine kinase
MGTPDGALEHATFAELRAQFRAESRASWVAAAGVALLAIAFAEPWGLALAALIVATALVRSRAFAPLARGDVARATVWKASGTWGVAVGVVAAIPDALPIMIINLIGPLVTGALYLDMRQLRRLTLAGVVVAIVLGALGFRSEGTGIEDGVPEWLFQMIMIVYLVMHVIMMILAVGTANRVRLDTLAAVAESNRALVESHAELRASRRRVIAAGDDARVRIERDIHDGAQQRLVALAVQLQLAAQLGRTGTPINPDQLESMHAESREAIDELRELARGVYPSVLTERGLHEALRSVARRSPNPVTVAYDPAIQLSAEDAAAVYFICVEALQNTAKHGGPGSSAEVSLRVCAGELIVSVVDDGPGFDPTAVGSSRGMLNMADRASALGGALTVDSSPGRGTRISMVVPDWPAANVDA